MTAPTRRKGAAMAKRELFVTSDGDMVLPGEGFRVLRAGFARAHRDIDNGPQFRASLRAGPYAWPGGYALAFVCDDGGLLCFDCARSEVRIVLRALRTMNDRSGWRVVGMTGEHESEEREECANCHRVLWDHSDEGEQS